MGKIKKEYNIFSTFLLFVISMCAMIKSISMLSFENEADYHMLFISIIVSIMMSMMIIPVTTGKGVIDFTDSLTALIFIMIGIQYAVIYSFIYSVVSEFLRDRILKRQKNMQRTFINVSMIVDTTFLSGIILNMFFKVNEKSDALTLCKAAVFFLTIFTIINLIIFTISMSFRAEKLYKLKKESSTIILTNYIISAVLLNVECIIYESNGTVGILFMYALLIMVNYCFYIYRKLENRNQCIKGLLNITSNIVKYGDFEQKCKYAVISLKKLIPYTICAIYSFDNVDSDIDVYPVAYNGPSNVDVSEFGFEFGRKSVTFKTIEEGKTYISKDVKNDKKIKINRKLLNYINTAIIVPIQIEDKIVGIIFIGGKDELTTFMINGINDILDILSNQIALAVENNAIYRNIKNKADKDQLTKLYNRRIFDAETRALIKSGTHFSLAIYDIDDFKLVNDTYGHIVGDRVLKNVSEIISKSIRKTDIACRYGGEEIAVIFKNLSKDDSYEITERIRQFIEDMDTHWYEKVVHVTVSGGVSSFPEDGNSIEELIESADNVLYTECKNKGKNRVSACNLKVIRNI